MGIFLAKFTYNIKGNQDELTKLRLVRADNIKIAKRKSNEWWKNREDTLSNSSKHIEILITIEVNDCID